MIGNKIAEIRKQRGYSLSELAKKTKISKSYLSNIERNLNKNPSLLIIRKLADVLEVDLERLVDVKNDQWNQQVIEKEWVDFVSELKGLGVEKDQLECYKTLLEFIKWRNHKVEKSVD